MIVGLRVGGAELMLKRLIEAHHGHPHYQHAVISLTDYGEIGPQLQAQGVEVFALGMRSTWGMPRALYRMAKLLRVAAPDIVQTWMYHADLLGGLAARCAGIRHVIWGIRTTDIKAGGSRATAVVRRLCAWLSTFIPQKIVCAADASRRAHERLGYDKKRMVVIPNGVELPKMVASPEQRIALRSQCGFGEDAIVVGSLARFHPVKDHANFVEAALLLAQQFPQVFFLMVGRRVDRDNRTLVERIDQEGFSDRFVLLGERSDVPVCLAAMDIFCLHSKTEGFPNVIGEAMAMGLPCVSTDVGDAALLLADHGVLVPKENAPALAQGLARLLAMSPTERQRTGEKAQERIRQNFSMDSARERFEALYAGVLAEEAKK